MQCQAAGYTAEHCSTLLPRLRIGCIWQGKHHIAMVPGGLLLPLQTRVTMRAANTPSKALHVHPVSESALARS